MNPARFLKNFLLIFVFFGLAGFSFSAYSSTFRWQCFAAGGGSAFVNADTGVAACAVRFPSSSSSFKGYHSGWQEEWWCDAPSSDSRYGYCRYTGTTSSPPDPLDPNSYYCQENPSAPECLGSDPDPEPEPEPEPEPDEEGFCDVYPDSEYCQPGFEPPEFCDVGVGSPACCHAYAYNDCRASGGVLENVFYRDFDNSCSWSCGTTPPPESQNPFPSPDPTPTPAPVSPSPSDPVNPILPSTPSDPSDPSNPVSVDVSGVSDRLDILIDLTAQSANITNQNIDELDFNTQTSLENVRNAVNTGFGNLTRILDPSGAEYLNPATFPSGDVGAGDSLQINSLLGVDGSESYSDLNSVVDLEDFSSEYTYTLPDSGCPAPREMQIMGSTFYFDYEPICEIFSFTGNLVILAGLFLTPIIVFGGRK